MVGRLQQRFPLAVTGQNKVTNTLNLSTFHNANYSFSFMQDVHNKRNGGLWCVDYNKDVISPL